MRKAALVLLFISGLLLTGPQSWAQNYDPFAEKDGESYDSKSNNQDEDKTFTGSVERLLNLAGEKKQPSTGDGPVWGKFEKLEPNQAQDKNLLYQYQIQEELSKPLPQRTSYKSDLDSLRRDLDSIRPTNKRDEDYLSGKNLRKNKDSDDLLSR